MQIKFQIRVHLIFMILVKHVGYSFFLTLQLLYLIKKYEYLGIIKNLI